MDNPAMQVALLILVVAATVWILGPPIAYLLGGQRLDVDIHAEPPLARPNPEDADGLRRYEAFIALGFRPIGWTSEHARFLTPIQWRWRAVEGSRWLAAPDDRTFVELYRVVKDEPVRFSAVTLFQGGGSCTTSCPGATVPSGGTHARFEILGVSPAELLEQHAQNVERLASERGVNMEPAALAKVAETTLAASLEHLRKSNLALVSMPLAIFALPSAVCVPWLFHDAPKRVFGAAGILSTALLYAAVRYGLLKFTTNWFARHMHTRAFQLEQTAVAADGTIAVGRYETWLRRLAVIGAIDMVARLAFVGVRVRNAEASFWSNGGSLLMTAAMVFVFLQHVRSFVARASGRGKPPGKELALSQRWSSWSSWSMVALFQFLMTRDAFTPLHIAWGVAAVALGVAGDWLEKNGRQ